MLFINISSDYVHVLDNNRQQFLPRNGIEQELWPVLLDTAPGCESIFLLNGPGGFTNLRVGTLLINTFNMLIHHDTQKHIPIVSITKPALYTYAYQQWWLPRYGVLYIGQKHNIWIYDFQQQTYQQTTLEHIQYSDDFFFDWVHDPYWEHSDHMISFSMENNQLCLHYNNEKHSIPLEALHLTPTMTVSPDYMIQPTMN